MLSASRFKEEIDVGIMGIVVVFLIKDVRLPPLNIVYRREWALIHDGGVDMCFEVRILLRFWKSVCRITGVQCATKPDIDDFSLLIESVFRETEDIVAEEYPIIIKIGKSGLDGVLADLVARPFAVKHTAVSPFTAQSCHKGNMFRAKFLFGFVHRRVVSVSAFCYNIRYWDLRQTLRC